MPELPEAETIARGLRDSLTGCGISSVEVLRADLLRGDPSEFSRSLTGASVRSISRRGKNLVLRIEGRAERSGEGRDQHSLVLVVNLGMSGRLLHFSTGSDGPAPSHPGVRLRLDDGSLLVYHDIRRFGHLTLMGPRAFRSWSRSLGPEPLSRAFTVSVLSAGLRRSGSPIRSWLLDQKRIAGVGNIYANEALFSARIHPRKPALDLRGKEPQRLHRAIRKVLRAAVAAQGTTLRDYRTAEGWQGSYARKLRVYGREGSPCHRCSSGRVERISFGGRSAFFCPACQPRTGVVD